jgi:hypothetical protein
LKIDIFSFDILNIALQQNVPSCSIISLDIFRQVNQGIGKEDQRFCPESDEGADEGVDGHRSGRIRLKHGKV